MFGNMTNGYDLSDIAAVTRGENDGFFGGNNGWWIILLFLFGFGGGGFGWGNRGDMNYATQADVRAAVDQQTLISKLDQLTYGLADSTYSLNNTMTNGFHGVDNAICTLGYQNQMGMNNLSRQFSDCCCETQRLLERGFADTNYNLATQACETRHAIADGTRQILDFLTTDKIATLQAENQTLKFAASQAAQNAYLVNELRPCPVPAYTVANPYCSYPVATACGGAF
jgi:hypothetical protein